MVVGTSRGGTRILKFGGTSLAEISRVERAVRLVSERAEAGDPPVVVVSALAGVTDALERLAMSAAAADGPGEGSEVVRRALERVVRRHRSLLDEAASREEAERAGLERLLRALRRRIDEVREADRCPPPLRDEVLSFGERLCAPIVAAAIRTRGLPAEVRPAQGLIVTDDVFGRARVRRGPSDEAILRQLGGRESVQVVPGFVGATSASRTTTLGRGGSDYTAAVVGAALGTGPVEIWTDVSGVMTADPRLVPGARRLPAVGYEEMWALSHFGARVVHPEAVRVARDAGLTLRVLDSSRPDEPGTRIQAESSGAEGPALAVAAAGSVFPGSGSKPIPHARLAVVGVRDGRQRELAERLSDALEAEEVELLASERVAVGSTLTLDVPWRQQTRAVSVVHHSLFGGRAARGAAAGGGA